MGKEEGPAEAESVFGGRSGEDGVPRPDQERMVSPVWWCWPCELSAENQLCWTAWKSLTTHKVSEVRTWFERAREAGGTGNHWSLIIKRNQDKMVAGWKPKGRSRKIILFLLLTIEKNMACLFTYWNDPAGRKKR